MSHAKNKLRWCLNKAEKELQEGNKKHRGLVEIKPDLNKAKAHVEKADHNLKVSFYLQKGGYTDWCSSTLFYTIYHCFLGILAKHGYESRNQECTFAVIHSLIEDGTINVKKKDMEKISSLDLEEKHEATETAVSIREEYQYTTKMSLEDKTLKELFDLASDILDKTKLIVEE